MSKFCTQCGEELNSKDSFCSKCGLKIDTQKRLDPTALPEIEKNTLNNLKSGKIIKRFHCLECGYSGPANILSNHFKWLPAVVALFVAAVLAVIAPSTSTFGAIIVVSIFFGNMTTIIRCPRCENKATKRGFSLNF